MLVYYYQTHMFHEYPTDVICRCQTDSENLVTFFTFFVFEKLHFDSVILCMPLLEEILISFELGHMYSAEAQQTTWHTYRPYKSLQWDGTLVICGQTTFNIVQPCWQSFNCFHQMRECIMKRCTSRILSHSYTALCKRWHKLMTPSSLS